MVLAEFLRAIARRWYVLLVGLTATVGLGYAATLIAPVEYTARGLVILVPPLQAREGGDNPFLVMSGLDLPARVLVAYFQSTGARAGVEAFSPDAEFVVAMDEGTRGPVISIEVTDTSPEGALATLQFLSDAIPRELARLQAEVEAPEQSIVTSMPLTMDQLAERDTGSALRTVIASVGLGVVAACVLTFTVDGLLLRRHLGRETEVDTDTTPPERPETPVYSDVEATGASEAGETRGAHGAPEDRRAAAGASVESRPPPPRPPTPTSPSEIEDATSTISGSAAGRAR